MPYLTASRRAVLGACLLLGACVAQPAADDGADYVLFFTTQSAALDPAALSILDAAAQAARATPRAQIVIAGYADRAGSPQANQILSRLRTQVVGDDLVGRGVDRGRIRLQPRGATGGDPGVESRRVEIRVGT